MSQKEWYTSVGFGGTPWSDPSEAARALARWQRRLGADAGTAVAAHNLRVHSYATRAEARRADITDRHGVLLRQGVDMFIYENLKDDNE
jgi:hypothetical protein